MTDLIEKQALSHPGISFHYRADGRDKLHTTGSGDLRIRKVDLPDGVTSDLPDGTVIKAGASRKATFRSVSAAFSSGLVTNDPVRPYKEIRTTSK